MARTPISDAASIFLQGGQLNQSAQKSFLQGMQGAADMYQRQQMQKEANLAAERMKQMEIEAQKAKIAAELSRDPQAILAQAIQNGPESLTPQQRALFEAEQQIQGAKRALDPLGRPFAPYQPISLPNGLSASPAAQMMVGTPPSATSGSAPMVTAPSAVDALLPPPDFGSSKSSIEQFNADFGQTPPSPLGSTEKFKKPSFDDFKSTSGAEGTAEGIKSKYEAELKFYGDKLSKDYEKDLNTEQQNKAKSISQQAIDRMIQLNEELNKSGALVSSKNSATANIRAALPNTPYIGATAEKIADPKVRAMRDEYQKLQSLLFPFYAKSSGLGATAIDSEGARKAMLDSMGDPNGVYEANKSQLQTLSKMIGTGAAKQTEKTNTGQFREGQTATNSATGEKLIFRGGTWQKM